MTPHIRLQLSPSRRRRGMQRYRHGQNLKRVGERHIYLWLVLAVCALTMVQLSKFVAKQLEWSADLILTSGVSSGDGSNTPTPPTTAVRHERRAEGRVLHEGREASESTEDSNHDRTDSYSESFAAPNQNEIPDRDTKSMALAAENAQDWQPWHLGHAQSKGFDFSKKDFSKYPPLSSRILPDMTTDKGGVIFYLHVPKTGGSSLRNHLGIQKMTKAARKALHVPPPDLPTEITQQITHRVKYIKANYLELFYERAVPRINDYLSGGGKPGPAAHNNNNDHDHTHNKVLVVEVHGMDSLNAIELEPYLQAWRKRSNETGIPFFAFTTLREALSHQVSFFNFYYLQGDPRFCDNGIILKNQICGKNKDSTTRKKRRWNGRGHTRSNLYSTLNEEGPLEEESAVRNLRNDNDKPDVDLEQAMVQLAYPNAQCLFLARGERSYGDHKEAARADFTHSECHQAYQSLRRTMDWIGRTDKLSEETLPLLTTMIFQDPSMGRNFPRANASPQQEDTDSKGFLHLSELQPSTRDGLENISQWDQELYQSVAQDYRIEQWVNYLQ